MKVVKKIFIILFCIAIIFAILSYIDYFLVKNQNTLPRISLKKVDEDKGVIVYKALFYKVWYCTSDGTTIIGDYSDPEAVCPSAYVFIDDYYTNASGLKISKKDLLLMVYKNVYTNEMIEVMSTDSQVENAVYVAENYGKTFSRKVEDISGTVHDKSQEYPIVIFPTFEKVDDTYEWVYDDTNSENYYCATVDSGVYKYSNYRDGYCEDNFKAIKMDKRWCDLSGNTTLVYIEGYIKQLCEE